MSDPIERLDRELRQMLMDVYNIGDSDAETLLEVVSSCMKAPGTLATAATVGATGAAVGGTISVGTLALPSWFVFAAAGYLGGTATCSIHNYTGAKAVEHFLRSSSINKHHIKNDVNRVLRTNGSKRTNHAAKSHRYRVFKSLDWSTIS
jgi:hypothetical protein